MLFKNKKVLEQTYKIIIKLWLYYWSICSPIIKNDSELTISFEADSYTDPFLSLIHLKKMKLSVLTFTNLVRIKIK
jgi:hypothetical protein